MNLDEEELILGAGRRWRPPPKPLAVLLLLVSLGAAFGLGYYVRGGTDRGAAAPRSARPAPSATGSAAAPVRPATPVEPAFEAVSDTDEHCSIQHGSTLQVGIQLLNSSARTYVISYVRVLLPLGGLRAAPVTPSTCGELGTAAPMAGQKLDPNAPLWLTTRLTVLMRCPAALPVQFEVHFTDNEQVAYGFSDLGEVPYSGCQ